MWFFGAAQEDLANDMVEERKEFFPNSKLKIIPLAGFVNKHQIRGNPKEDGGFVVTVNRRFSYENQMRVGFANSVAGHKALEEYVL